MKINACPSCNDLAEQLRTARSRITELERQLASERQDTTTAARNMDRLSIHLRELSDLVDVQRDIMRGLTAELAAAMELSESRATANRELYTRAMGAETELDALRARGFWARVFG